MKRLSFLLLGLFLVITPSAINAQQLTDDQFKIIENQVIEWRRHCHQYPELSNREFNTGKYIAEQLTEMGIDIETGVAHTGVVGFIKGGQAGPTVALRADIDGLPVVERVDLPFASKEKTSFFDQEVGVMHACGHDTHIAMLLGTAKLLKSQQANLKGNILLIFQPAEEGAPPGEEGGAKLIVKEGYLKKYAVDVIFGQHINSGLDVNKITYKFGGTMAAADRFTIKVKGKQAHGSRPWTSVDPIVVSAQIILGLQTIVSRQSELTKEAVVITVGKIQSGVRNNIIPEEAEMVGTIRTLDVDMQEEVHKRIKRTAELIAESAGAVAEVTIEKGYPITYNDPDLTRKMLPTLFRSAGEDQVLVVPARTGAEDFSFYAQEVPGLFYFLGGKNPATSFEDVGNHHTPDFYVDESGLLLGVKTMYNLAVDYMEMHKE